MARRELWEQVDGDLYAILAVTPDATNEQIQAAWREAAKRTHPDKGGSISEFQQVELAFQVLSNPLERDRYDRAFAAAGAAAGDNRGGSAPGRARHSSATYSATYWPPNSGRPGASPGPHVEDPYALPETNWSTWQVLLAVVAAIIALVTLVLFAAIGLVLIAIVGLSLGIGSMLRRNRGNG